MDGSHQDHRIFITLPELRTLVPYSAQHIRRLEAQGLFPQRVRIGLNRVGWVRSEIAAWIETKIEGRKS